MKKLRSLSKEVSETELVILRLWFAEQLSDREIADVLNMHRKKVQRTRAAVLARLRKHSWHNLVVDL